MSEQGRRLQDALFRLADALNEIGVNEMPTLLFESLHATLIDVPEPGPTKIHAITIMQRG